MWGPGSHRHWQAQARLTRSASIMPVISGIGDKGSVPVAAAGSGQPARQCKRLGAVSGRTASPQVRSLGWLLQWACTIMMSARTPTRRMAGGHRWTQTFHSTATSRAFGYVLIAASSLLLLRYFSLFKSEPQAG